jgi:energy-coupling factor transporter ATP-binding protein EcfA2|tara:strand:- start:122 stop:2077 length:1956 start_codon:yes stop_codon:yes gene_type:complete
MIVGVILRYYKTYSGRNYIPLTDEDNFCGLVGNNGIGKSSVLESFDTFFNNKNWNINSKIKKTGTTTTTPEIVPIFLINKDRIPSGLTKLAVILDKVARSNFDSRTDTATKGFVEHRKLFSSRIDLGNKFVLPIGIDLNGNINLSFFNNSNLVSYFFEDDFYEGFSDKYSKEDKKNRLDIELDVFKYLLSFIRKDIDYIYIPREIDTELFTKLETKEIQLLMGEKIEDVLKKVVPDKNIKEINKQLNIFINQVGDELDPYNYRTPTERQQNLKKSDLYNLIIQAFFSTRTLYKKQGNGWLDISLLSSGEKQKAMIHIAHNLLKKHRKGGDNLIIGVDEPESSLHISACYDQFDALYDISRDCMQVFFSTHWYGFLPTVESGSATFITKKEENHRFDQVNLSNYREHIRQLKEATKYVLPFDIRLKGMNDFVQSVISSATSDEPYNWLICEGSSEKIYLTHYFKDLIAENRLRIVPIGGASEIKKFYTHIAVSYNDFKSELKGKIYLLSDTDKEIVNYPVVNDNKLSCQRMVSNKSNKTTELVKIDSNNTSPETEIENVLNGKAFYKCLFEFKNDYIEQLGFLDKYDINDAEECCSRQSLDLTGTEDISIENFFDEPNVKYNFSVAYCETLNDGYDYEVPDWINSIRNFFVN